MTENTKASTLRELIRVLVRGLGVLEKDEAACCGITIAQCHTLVEIGRASELSLNDLASRLGLNKSSASRAVDTLVKQGFVKRNINSSDRRFVTINLTASGTNVFKTIETSMNQYYSDILRSLPRAKQAQILESLNLLIEAIKINKCCER